MVFSSQIFLCVFFPVTVAVYVAVNYISKKNTTVLNTVLLIASLVFYLWALDDTGMVYIGVLLTVNFFIGYILSSKGKNTPLTVAGVIFNILLLIHFKYPGFLLNILGGTASGESIIVPLGMSFIAFHAVSYLIDLNRSVADIKPQKISFYKQFIHCWLYLLYFPKACTGSHCAI